MSSVINVKINDNDEIEYVNLEETHEEEFDEYEVFDDDNNILVPSGDGVMTIKPKESVKKTYIEHVCGKCNKSYKSIGYLKRHMNVCRNLPIIKTEVGTKVMVKPQPADEEMEKDAMSTLADLSDLDDDTCYCCFEKKETAHSGHIRCNFCPKSFKSHINLERHLFSVHSASANFACSSCNATCPNQMIFDLHMESHGDGKPFSCTNCGKDFTRRYHLDRHLNYTGCDKARPKAELPCQVCNKVFSRIDNLREHLRGHMGQPGRRKDYECPYCERCFYGSSLLSIHIRTHTGEKPFPCDLCGKSFPSNGALRKHRRMHTGEKPYACKQCDKTFSAKETLNRHMKIHTGVRPHVCTICPKSFIQATQLRAHMFNHTGENGFACGQCDRSFSRKARLDAHMRQGNHGNGVTGSRKNIAAAASRTSDDGNGGGTQQDLRNDAKSLEICVAAKKKATTATSTEITCDICYKKFKNLDNLVRHMDAHRGIKEFTCTECDKHFSTKASHAVHMKTHIEEEPCVCKVCKVSCRSLDVLMRHMRAKHRDILYSIISEDRPKTITKRSALPATMVKPDDEVEYDNTVVEDVEYDNDEETQEFEIIELKTESFADDYPASSIKNDIDVVAELKQPLTDHDLTENVGRLLNLLVDEQTLSGLGWPSAGCESVLSAVIQQCGQTPADYTSCPDYATKMRENSKLLFTAVIDNESIKQLLNNHSVDEVIVHVLKLAA